METQIPELRARLMRKIWSAEELSSEEKADNATLRAWEELEPQRSGAPFQFLREGQCQDFPSCLARIRLRVAELQQLLPIFEGVTSLSFLRGSVLKEFQRLISLLDLAGRGMLPKDFSEWEAKLDQIDQSLEKAFNQVGAQLRQKRSSKPN